ncbi:hypothetical protein [Bacillus mojavensis]|uniref:hypothetical protein n=1 Tax=Bacillus mojavensis TaxID=72360 RepID=UPI00398ADEB4
MKREKWGSSLFIDTFFLWNHAFILPALSEGQEIAFAIWMVCAYAIYLFIPLLLSYRKWFRFNFQTSFVRE